MRVENVKIENQACFRYLEFKPGNFTIISGTNGSGKSILLKKLVESCMRDVSGITVTDRMPPGEFNRLYFTPDRMIEDSDLNPLPLSSDLINLENQSKGRPRSHFLNMRHRLSTIIGIEPHMRSKGKDFPNLKKELFSKFYDVFGFRFDYDIINYKMKLGAKLNDGTIGWDLAEFSSGEQQFLFFLTDFIFYGQKDIPIFIDEPEVHLHPNLLIQLLNIIKKVSEKHQVFICTHSPYLILSSDLDHLYWVDCKLPKGNQIIQMKENPTLIVNLLDALGELNYLEKGSNYIVDIETNKTINYISKCFTDTEVVPYEEGAGRKVYLLANAIIQGKFPGIEKIKLVDFGCGDGPLLKAICKSSIKDRIQYIPIDKDISLAKSVSKRASENGIESDQFFQDLFQLDSFNVLTIINTLHHLNIDEILSFIEKAHKIMDKSSLIFISDLAFYNKPDRPKIHFNQSDINNLFLPSYFKIEFQNIDSIVPELDMFYCIIEKIEKTEEMHQPLLQSIQDILTNKQSFLITEIKTIEDSLSKDKSFVNLQKYYFNLQQFYCISKWLEEYQQRIQT